MKSMLIFRLWLLMGCIFYMSCNGQTTKPSKSSNDKMVTLTKHQEVKDNEAFEVNKTDSDWKKELTPEQYAILREKGTERPFTSSLEDNYDGGTYTCAACGNELFTSDAKFDSGCG